MTPNMSTFLTGARDVSPLLLGVLPFGLITGAVGVNVGMPEWAAIGTSQIIFAGASQLVVMQLMAEHASMAVIILTALVINARMFMYSASLAPHFNGMPSMKKAMLAYFLTDQAYAVSITKFDGDGASGLNKAAYYLGAGMLMWFGFNSTTVMGAYLGAFIPASWNLDFAIPLTFIALVVPAVKDRPNLVAAAAAALVALAADALPYNLGLMAAAMVGITVGYAIERRLTNG